MACTDSRTGVSARPERHPYLTVIDLAAEATLWLLRIRQRRSLARLDDRGLQDIGLTRAEALREAAKPFWRA